VKYKRATNQYRSAAMRVKDWDEIYNHDGVMTDIQQQAARYQSLLVKFSISAGLVVVAIVGV